jgi:hypothetical protein
VGARDVEEEAEHMIYSDGRHPWAGPGRANGTRRIDKDGVADGRLDAEKASTKKAKI